MPYEFFPRGKCGEKLKTLKPIMMHDPRFALTAPKPAGEEETKVADQEKFILRLPAGMRDRIKASAVRNKRSMMS